MEEAILFHFVPCDRERLFYPYPQGSPGVLQDPSRGKNEIREALFRHKWRISTLLEPDLQFDNNQ